MPGFLLTVASLSASAFGGGSLVTQGLVGAVGPFIVDRFSTVVRHDWPIKAHSRDDLLDRIFMGDNGDGACLRRTIEWAANSDNEETHKVGTDAARALGADPENVVPAVPDDAAPYVSEMERRRPGLWAELISRGCYIRRANGHCLDPVIGTDGAMVLDPAARIRRGDVAMFAARGCPTVLGKAFVGICDGVVFFWMANPDLLLAINAADILHVDRVTMIQPKGGEPFEPPTVQFPHIENATLDWQSPPKMRTMGDAHEAALWSIVDAARALPTADLTN